ncbi:MAG: carboxymuconolactone decarboxylase family protein [Gemmatimonadetes bacterium]|nr:carboxymuconolactone decarboxylase family protein [Gemmatimonadota bacterium]
MAWIRTISARDAGVQLAEVYAAIQSVAGGVANIVQVQSLNPRALRDHYALYRTVMYGESPLSRVEREAIAVVVSAENGCHY